MANNPSSSPQSFGSPSMQFQPAVHPQPLQLFPLQPQQTAHQMPLSSSYTFAPQFQSIPASGSNPSLQSSSDWKEHKSADGRPYYYNKNTRQSSWQKPLELMTPIERADASTDWKEFTTPDGRKYYYNKVTKLSKWTIPDELNLARQQALTASTPAVPLPLSGSSPIPIPIPIPIPQPVEVKSPTPLPAPVLGNTDAFKKEKGNTDALEEDKKGQISITPVKKEPLVVYTKQETKSVFKALLESSHIGSDWSWEQAMRVIINDKRYGALKTLGERKQAFNEYLGERKKLEAEEKRLKQKKAREEFRKMLESSKKLISSMRWRDAVSIFEDDKRFKAIERGREREALFEDYVLELEKNEKRKAKEANKQHRIEFRRLLESCDFINVNSQWRKVEGRLQDLEACLHLNKCDCLLVFEEYISDLEKEEEEERNRQREQLKRAERKNREEFRKFMDEHVAAGTLTAKTHWHDYCMKVRDSSAYLAVSSNTSGPTPKDLFEDTAEELEKQYQEDRTRIKHAMKLGKIALASTWTIEDFKPAILENVGSPQISDINIKLVFEELWERDQEKKEREAKKRQRLAEDFTELLRSKEITTSSDWEDCKSLLEESQEYTSIGDESFKRGIFEQYIKHLQEKAREKEHRREDNAKKEKELAKKEKRKEEERGREREKKHWKRYQSVVDEGSSDEDEKEESKSRRHRSGQKSSIDEESSDEAEKAGLKKYRGHRSNRKSVDEGSYDEDQKEESKKYQYQRHRSDREIVADNGSSDEDEKEESKQSRRHRSHRKIVVDDGSSNEDEKEESKKSHIHESDRKKIRKHVRTPESDSDTRYKRHKRDHWDGSRRNVGYNEFQDGEFGEDEEIW